MFGTLSALLLFVSVITGSTAEARFSAGAARADITPDLRLSNWVTHKPYGTMLEPIFARAVVLAQGDNRVALVSWELLYAMEGAVAEVRRRIQAATGIASDHILISATHNHSAPWAPIIGDPLTQAEHKVLEAFLSDPVYPEWQEKLFLATVKAVRQADEQRVPATLGIVRTYAGDMIFNRRPRRPDGTVQSMMLPPNPYALAQGLRFGPMDPTFTLLSLRSSDHKAVAAIGHLPCHAVGIYPSFDGISGDWPGALCDRLQTQFGGEAMVLQGCAGDMVPIRRGQDARSNMVSVLSERCRDLEKLSFLLPMTNALRVANRKIHAPLDTVPRKEMGRGFMSPEVQVVTCGDLAIVALPGEPLIGLALEIQKRSPMPHTLVVGYANGYGTQYVGLPGEKALGGYETTSRNLGQDQCGQLLVDTTIDLLKVLKTEMQARN